MKLLLILMLSVVAFNCHTRQTLSRVGVIHNANIYTVNPAQPRAAAMAFDGEGILALGDSDELLSRYPDATHLDAEGRTVIPGLIDAHAHLLSLGYNLIDVDLKGTTSIDEIRARLRTFASSLGPGDWVLGRGWDQNDWEQQVYPSREDLDDLFPERPVWLRRIDGHAAWANSAAIREAGMDRLRAASDPNGGRIMRDEHGELTGIFIDAAMPLVSQVIPARSESKKRRALELAVHECSKHGLTGVHDAGVSREELSLYRQAIQKGQFDLRVYAMVSDGSSAQDDLCESGPFADGSGRLDVRSVKVYMDGALGSRGAALLQPYTDDPENTGLLRHTAEEFEERVRHASRCGLQVCTHAIGDRANRIALDVYERVFGEDMGSGRHRIEHAQILHADDIARFAELDVVGAVQPTHATSDMYWAEDRVGPERVLGAYVWRGLLETGARLALGSDFPIEDVNPLLGFYAAVTRQDTTGWPEGGWSPVQVLTRPEALKGFTLDAAYAGFAEQRVGSLEPGKRADFVVLSANIMEMPANQIPATRVVATYLDGKPVFGAVPIEN